MFVYLLFFWAIAMFSILDFTESNNRKLCLFIIWVLCSLFIGTREMGPDYYVYNVFYSYVPKLDALADNFQAFTARSKFEPLYIIITSLFSTLGISFEIFHLLFTATFCALFIFSVHKYTPHVFVAIMVYIGFAYFSGWSAIRQFMAGSIFIYALQFIIEGKRFKFLILIILALLFHYSAIVLLPIVFLRNWKISKGWCFVLICGVLVIYFSGMLKAISSFVFSFFPFLDQSKVNRFANNEEDTLISTIFFLWIIILSFLNFNRDKFKDYYNFNILFNIYLFSFLMYVLILSFGDLGRINMYNKLLHAIMFPFIVFAFREGRALAWVALALISSITIYKDITSMDSFQERAENSSTLFVPYKSWLF
ncbi:EpsG family protein [Sphingobacterium puteale]|uniref:EpsG family protein n=1 Tax=Sphingobacterium puteale TaxID=2420510 RepID=UPI003D95BEBE